MIREDARSRCVAIIPDLVLNPGSALYDGIGGGSSYVIDALTEEGWGIMAAPPHILAEESAARAVATVAGDAVDYLRHEYTVVIVALNELPQGGVWLNLFEAAFRAMETSAPRVLRIGMTGSSVPTPEDFRTTLRASQAGIGAEGRSPTH